LAQTISYHILITYLSTRFCIDYGPFSFESEDWCKKI